MNYARRWHTATVLKNGKVLIAGGIGIDGYLDSAELYDPPTRTWSIVDSMSSTRHMHTASLLPNGKVLIVGGHTYINDTSYSLNTAELYDPITNTWKNTGNMNYGREEHTASLLPNGKILITGGYSVSGQRFLKSAELYDPATETWTITGNMNYTRQSQSASVLKNGKVLVAGGFNNEHL
ncbi:unnamed protein product, partial [Rotaria sp. Silwood2]